MVTNVAKIDTHVGLNWEDAAQVRKEFPQMPFLENQDGGAAGGFAIYMRTDKPPYNDKRVRQAMMLATDYNTIEQTINGGTGNIITFPYTRAKGYEDLYVGLDDPDLPPAVKDLYTYNPDKARKLLAEDGFPNGLKTSIRY